MEGLWLIAFVALWILNIAEFLAILGLVHQIGLLHLRLGPPPGPLVTDEGLKIGSEAPAFDCVDVVGNMNIGFPPPPAESLILLFVEPGCGVCLDLLPRLNGFGRSHARNVALVVVSRSIYDTAREMASNVGALFPIASDAEGKIFAAYAVSHTPFAYLIKEGHIAMKGVVNTRDHLESLLERQGTNQGPRPFVSVP